MSCDSLLCSAGEVDYDRLSFGEHSLYSWGNSCMTVMCFSQMTATPLWLLLVHLPLRVTQVFFSGFWINYFKMISGSDSTFNEQSHKRTEHHSSPRNLKTKIVFRIVAFLESSRELKQPSAVNSEEQWQGPQVKCGTHDLVHFCQPMKDEVAAGMGLGEPRI